MKKKLLISINSDLYIRNYIDTKSFIYLQKKYDCFFVSSKNDLYNKKYLKKNINKKKFLGFINYPYKQNLNFQKYLYRNFLINEKNSQTIDYLTKLRLRSKFYWNDKNFFNMIIMILPRLFSFIKNNLFFYYLRLLKKNEFKYPINNKIFKIYNKLNPDLILFPMQDSHILSYDLLRLSKKKKSLALIDNWDNLSSRGSYSIIPDYISVWGHQTKKHALKYHDFIAKNVFLIGTPRFDKYFKYRKKKINSNFNFKYFLFLESFGNYDNIDVLKKLDKIILNCKIWNKYKIVYRPHPWQKKNNLIINEKNFKNLIIDPQIYSKYKSQNNSTKFQPNINYYPSLLQNAEIVITGPTSMLIESAIFYKKTLLLGYNNSSETPYSEELRHYVHLNKVKLLPNTIVCKKLSNLTNDLEQLKKININKNKIDKVRNYFLYNSNLSYGKRLEIIVKKILRD